MQLKLVLYHLNILFFFLKIPAHFSTQKTRSYFHESCVVKKLTTNVNLQLFLGNDATTSVETKPTNTYSGTHAPMTSQLVTGRKTVAADNGVEARHLQRSVHLDP